MHSVIANDRKEVEKGKVLKESINQGIGAFNPDMMYEKLVKDYSLAEQLYGEKLLQYVSGYDSRYLERNINVPEFRKVLKDKIKQKIRELKEEKYLDQEGTITEKGNQMATLITYTEELDKLHAKGYFGERETKKIAHYGEKTDVKIYRKGDRYKDLAVRKAIKLAARRGHTQLHLHDLTTFERKKRGRVCIIYCIDASGSMKGEKIDTAKKAGIALAFKAMEKKDLVGAVIFSKKVKAKIHPTDNFGNIIREITLARAESETDFVNMLQESILLFPKRDYSKHMILITDALQTVGTEQELLQVISRCRDENVTISVIGISLDKQGQELAKNIVEVSNGHLYVTKQLEEIDSIVLEDYAQYS